MARLDAHLASCPACTARWQAMQRVSTLLKAEPLARPTPGFTERVLRRVAMLPARQVSWPLVVRPRIAVIASVVAMAALVTLAWLVAAWAGQPVSLMEIPLAGLKSLTTLVVTAAGLWRVGRVVLEVVLLAPSRLFLLTDCLLGLLLLTLWVRLLRRPVAGYVPIRP
jgi:predicted anti-sigma-YlaC factor YlaD